MKTKQETEKAIAQAKALAEKRAALLKQKARKKEARVKIVLGAAVLIALEKHNAQTMFKKLVSTLSKKDQDMIKGEFPHIFENEIAERKSGEHN